MFTGKVIGTVVCTVKDESLTGIKLLLVRTLKNGAPDKVIVAADALGVSGYGDFVYLISSKEAALTFRKKYTPVDAAIMGIIDDYNVPSKV
jgi:microcompartment protein CcmK/EutM